jgi:hypothetical protein
MQRAGLRASVGNFGLPGRGCGTAPLPRTALPTAGRRIETYRNWHPSVSSWGLDQIKSQIRQAWLERLPRIAAVQLLSSVR